MTAASHPDAAAIPAARAGRRPTGRVAAAVVAAALVAAGWLGGGICRGLTRDLARIG